ncbi:hypothetical protein HOLleu_02967 [Holothuria leucospilota]|uniref:Uncharacterized protein n=1 Tax=Holothuria leucospilota TaxID=206669 RepID=A0A9Q1HHD4_HOLLE|nr:hypothetical protein HOLleu_02967 [Holothuria leucospilota]
MNDSLSTNSTTANVTAMDDVPQTNTAERKQNIGFASRFATPEDVGKSAPESLANSLNYLMTSKLEDTQITDTCTQYLQPDNCPHLVVPKVNPTIWDNLNSKTRSTDLRLQRIQKPLVKGLFFFLLLSPKNKELSETEQDVLALLSNSIFELNMFRKESIKPDLNQRYTHLCKQDVKSTRWLFGDDLSKTVKDMDEEQKTAGVMKHKKFAPRFNPMGGRPSRSTFGFQQQ